MARMLMASTFEPLNSELWPICLWHVYTKLATAYPLKSGPMWEGIETDSDYTSSAYTSDSESDSDERGLLYAIFRPDMVRPHMYTVNVDEGLKQTPEKYDLEGQARWPAFVKHQESRVKSNVDPLSQPYLLGDKTRTFYLTNTAKLTQKQQPIVVKTMRAMVAKHKLNPESVQFLLT